MKAIILAAGKGTRLAPLTENKPKTLIKVNGETLLERLIELLIDCGIDDIIVVVGYLKDQILNVVKKYETVKVISNNDYDKTDNMYSIMLCEQECSSSPFIITMGDAILSKDIILDSLNMESSNIPVEMDPNLKDGQKILIEDGFVKGIGKTLSVAQATGINIYKFSKNDAPVLFNQIRKIIHDDKKPNEWIEVAINNIVDKINMVPLNITGKFWLEIDDHQDLEEANRLLNDLSNG